MLLNGGIKGHTESQAAVECGYMTSTDVKDDCTSRLCGSGLESPFGDILPIGSSRVLSKSSAKIE